MPKKITNKTRSKIVSSLSKEPQTLSQIQKNTGSNYYSILRVIQDEVDTKRATPIGDNRVRKASFFERIKNMLRSR